MLTAVWNIPQFCPVLFLLLMSQTEVTYGTEINIASHAALSVSSTISYNGNDYSKENAVDGYVSSNTDTCGCCYISAQEQSPYFEARFRGNFKIDRIIITGRQDNSLDVFRLSDIVVRLNNIVERVILDSSHKEATVYPTTASSHIHTIRISRPRWYLAICELQVMSSGCIDGYYGNNCDQTCGACSDGRCSRSSGRCLHGCSGDFQGDHCDSCIDGYYGNNCDHTCGACSDGRCSRSSGRCLHGCSGDFQGDHCDSCIDGNYGNNCNETCGACSDGRCSRSSGRCLHGCSGDFQGDHCDSCNDGSYGATCNSTCGNCTGGRCDMLSGRCTQGCSAGYQGDMCDTNCTEGMFGPNCAYMCHCKNQTACDMETGICQFGCDVGWTGSNCSAACPNGIYGEDCTQVCHCLNQGQCDRFHGNCSTGCNYGWTGFSCNTATSPLFPVNASAVDYIRPYENNVHVVKTSVPLVFLGKSYSQLYITKDGLVSFGKAALYRHQNWSAPDVSPFINTPFIAPYYFQAQSLDVLPDYTGTVTFREYNAYQLSHMNLSHDIRSAVVGSGGFSADWAIQITWMNVTSVEEIETGPCKGTYSYPCPTNTFQLVLLSNGVDSYAIFNYGSMKMPPGKYDQAGLNGGHGIGWTNVLTFGESVDQLSHQQGSNVLGRYMFKISSRQILRGGCSRNPNHNQLTLFPNYAGMYGGKMIDISGPCFATTDDVRCRFGTQQPGGQPPPESQAVYISQTRVRCMVPRLLVRDRILLSLTLGGRNYSYSAPFTIILPARMPEAEHVIAVSSSSSATNWLGKNPTTLTLTWDGSLLSDNQNALVDIILFGYKEVNGKGEYQEMTTLGTWVRASAGTYTFHTAEHQCSRDECFKYEIGMLTVSLQDRFVPKAYRYLSSRILPLGWWVQNAMASTHGTNWPSALCVDWYNKDKQDKAWLQNLLHCPCSLEQALADFGRWQPDMTCNIVNTSPDNCFYHKGASHCVRAVQPVGASGNQCCYKKNGQLVFAQDSFQGSTPDRSHDWGAAPYGKPGFVPSLSHWLTDVVTFYYCCLWNEYNTCDYYMDSRPTKDCVGYTPPIIASVYGQGHVMPFGGPTNNFRIIGPGDYTLLKAGNTIVQGRFERNLFPTEAGKLVTSVYSLTAVAVKNVGESDTVELLLRGPGTNNDHQKIDVRVNGKYLEFDEDALAWHDLQGVAVINTDRVRRVQSNFTVILTNNIGLQVVEVTNMLQLDVVVPQNTFSNVTGLLGDLDGSFRTPDGTKVDLQALNTSSAHFYYKFEVPWMVHNRSSSLIHGFLFAYQNLLGSVNFHPTYSPGCASALCNGYKDCEFDILYTCSEQIAQGTVQAMDRLAMLRQYLQPVRSCGLLDVPRAIKSSYSYTLGTTTSVQKCRLGSLSGPTTYTCTATSNQTQEWTPAVKTTCGNFTQPSIVG